jgi:hypothetical protein
VLGLEHRHLQDAMEVDDLGGGASFVLLRAHAWRARSARCRLSLLCLAARGWAFIAVFPTWQSAKGKKESHIYWRSI